MDDPMTRLVQAQQEAAARFAKTWSEMMAGTASQATGTASPADVQAQFRELTRSMADYASAAVQPLKDLAAGQREFADRMSRWAELQRDLADNMAAWAAQQREYADNLDRMLAPFTFRQEAS